MDWNQYQNDAAKTAIYPGRLGAINGGSDIRGIIYTCLGFAGEAGELLEKVGDPSATGPSIVAEEGDVLWYISQLAMELTVPMSMIANDGPCPTMTPLGHAQQISIDAGACADIVKKVLRDSNGHMRPGSRTALLASLSDALTHCVVLSTMISGDIGDVCHTNIAKLADRQARNALHGNGDNR